MSILEVFGHILYILVYIELQIAENVESNDANQMVFSLKKYSYLTELWSKNGAYSHIWAYASDLNSAIFGPMRLQLLWELRVPLSIDW